MSPAFLLATCGRNTRGSRPCRGQSGTRAARLFRIYGDPFPFVSALFHSRFRGSTPLAPRKREPWNGFCSAASVPTCAPFLRLSVPRVAPSPQRVSGISLPPPLLLSPRRFVLSRETTRGCCAAIRATETSHREEIPVSGLIRVSLSG